MTQETTYIMFIDESTTTDGNYLCALGLIVPTDFIVNFCKGIEEIIKTSLGEEYSIYKNINLKCIRRPKYDESPFIKLKREERHKISLEIYGLLEKYDCVLIASIVYRGFPKGTEKHEKEEWKPSPEPIFDWRSYFYFIIERYYYFLGDNNSHGIVVFDESMKSRINRKDFVEIVRGKDYREKKFYKRIYCNVFFTNDEFDILTQVADLIAYTLSNYIYRVMRGGITIEELAEKYDFRYETKKHRFYDSIVDRFRAFPGPEPRINGYGIKVW